LAGCTVNNSPAGPSAAEVAQQIQADLAARQQTATPSTDYYSVSQEARNRAVEKLKAMSPAELYELAAITLEGVQQTVRKQNRPQLEADLGELAAWTRSLEGSAADSLTLSCTANNIERFNTVGAKFEHMATQPWTAENSGSADEQTRADYDAALWITGAFLEKNADDCYKLNDQPVAQQQHPQQRHHRRKVNTPMPSDMHNL
jgi:hypothetical protein